MYALWLAATYRGMELESEWAQSRWSAIRGPGTTLLHCLSPIRQTHRARRAILASYSLWCHCRGYILAFCPASLVNSRLNLGLANLLADHGRWCCWHGDSFCAR